MKEHAAAPRSHFHWINLVNVLVAMQQWQAALEAIDQAIRSAEGPVRNGTMETHILVAAEKKRDWIQTMSQRFPQLQISCKLARGREE